MSKSYPLILKAAAETPWAVDRRKLEQIAAFLQLKADGLDVPEELRAEVTAARHAASKPHVARGVAIIPVLGVISYRVNMLDEISGGGGTSIQQLTSDFREAVNNPDVGTIVLQIDSPGGAVGGIPELADEIFAARDQKKIIAVADTMSASAAYWLMSAASEVVVTPSGEVGSIGVYAMHLDESAALEMEGLRPTFISAGKFKTEGHFAEPLGDEARAAIQADVDAFYAMFTKAVAKGRGVPVGEVRNGFGQARMVLAKDAKAMGMVDRVDTFSNVLARLGVDVGTGQNRKAMRAEEKGLEAFVGVDFGGKNEALVYVVEAGSEYEYGIGTWSPDAASKPQGIIFGKDYKTGNVYVLSEWPERTTVSSELLVATLPGMEVDGDRLAFTCENGTAEYVKDGETLSGDWTCRLIESTYEHQPWPLEQASETGEDDTPAEPAHNPRRRRLALLKHA